MKSLKPLLWTAGAVVIGIAAYNFIVGPILAKWMKPAA